MSNLQEDLQDDFPKAKKITSSLAKFSIGFIAGCSIALIPKLSSYILSGDQTTLFNYFSTTSIVVVLVFSIFLGLIVLITEYKFPKTPKETFYAALAFPGLIAGSFSVVTSDSEIQQVTNAKSEFTKSIIELNRFQMQEIEAPKLIPLTSIHHSKSINETTMSAIEFSFISNLHAADTNLKIIEKQSPNSYFIRGEVARYVVSIGTYDTIAEAKESAKNLLEHIPSIALIEVDKKFELLLSEKVLTQSAATLKALEIKHMLKINPKLLMIK